MSLLDGLGLSGEMIKRRGGGDRNLIAYPRDTISNVQESASDVVQAVRKWASLPPTGIWAGSCGGEFMVPVGFVPFVVVVEPSCLGIIKGSPKGLFVIGPAHFLEAQTCPVEGTREVKGLMPKALLVKTAKVLRHSFLFVFSFH